MLAIIFRKVVSNYLPRSRNMREGYLLHSFVNTGHCSLQWIPILTRVQDPAWSLISLLLFVYGLISLWPHWAQAHSHTKDFALIHSAWNTFSIGYLIIVTPSRYSNVILLELPWGFCLWFNTFCLSSTARHLSPSYILLNSFVYLVYQLTVSSSQNVNSIRPRISLSSFFPMFCCSLGLPCLKQCI